jgi:hypothetical protein
VQPRRFLLLDAKNEPQWLRLYVQPIGEQWVAMLVADGAEPPRAGKLKGLGSSATRRLRRRPWPLDMSAAARSRTERLCLTTCNR